MARRFNYALNKIQKQTSNSYRKIKVGAKDYDGKPISKEKQIWHSGRLNGLKTAKSAFFAGRKQGFTQGRKRGFKSGINYGRMSARRFGRAF